MWPRRTPKAQQRPTPTREEIIARWRNIKDDAAFIYSEEFNGLDPNIQFAVANRLLDRFLANFERCLELDAA